MCIDQRHISPTINKSGLFKLNQYKRANNSNKSQTKNSRNSKPIMFMKGALKIHQISQHKFISSVHRPETHLHKVDLKPKIESIPIAEKSNQVQ